MSLLDDFSCNQIILNNNKFNININKNLEKIDKLIIDINRQYIMNEYDINLLFFIYTNNTNLVLQKYGVDYGYYLYYLYLFILDYYVKIIIVYGLLHNHPT